MDRESTSEAVPSVSWHDRLEALLSERPDVERQMSADIWGDFIQIRIPINI